MSDLNYPFKSHSKSEWQEKVTQDLKGRPIESLDWQWEGMSFGPLYHSKDKLGESKISKASNSWYINQNILIDNAENANKMAMNALNGGCNCLTFEFGQTNVNSINLKQLLKGIRLDWIVLQLISNQEEELLQSLIEDYILQNRLDRNNIKIASKHEVLDGRELYKIIKSTKDNPLDQDKEIFEIVRSQVNKNAKFIWNVSASDHFYSTLCRIRAIRIILTENNWSDDCLIQVNIKPSNAENDVNYRFMQSTCQAISAAQGGADIINIESSQNDTFEDRINRNINHLLQLESHLDHVIDPAAGSYFFESMTQKIYTTLKN